MARTQTDPKKQVRRKSVKRRAKSTATAKRKSPARRESARRHTPDELTPVEHRDSTLVYRARMQLVGGLLNSAFEQVMSPIGDERGGKSAPGAGASVRRIGQGAYLQIMGQVFAALFDLSRAIPIDELVKLSRIVAEQRRAEAGAQKAGAAIGGASNRTGAQLLAHDSDTFNSHRELPESFGDMVRQIYGVSVTDSAVQRNGRDHAISRPDEPAGADSIER